jgi:hypothetical protein
MIDNNLLDTRMVQRRVKALAARLGELDFTINTQSTEDGSPHIEVSDAYYLVVRERGIELSRKRTANLDELLYWILEGLTAQMSWDFELRHRREGEDSRRQAFAKQIELLATLSSEWAERQRLEQAAILERHPFHDS